MAHPILAPYVLDGWYVLHQFFRVEPIAPRAAEDDGAAGGLQSRAEDLAKLLRSWEDLGSEGWSGLYRIVGGGADILLLHFRSSLEALGQVEREIRRSPLAEELVPTADYVSVVELGLYSLTNALIKEAQERGVDTGSESWQAMVDAALAEEAAKKYVQGRLHPTQPDEMPYVCFYPMDKRRKVEQNWYSLPMAERAALMAEHGNTGRRYAGRISQIISGSVGLDDWEWGVTLFAVSPLDLKAIVTEMRYDEVSALYAEFGSFWVGHRIPGERIVEELSGLPEPDRSLHWVR